MEPDQIVDAGVAIAVAIDAGTTVVQANNGIGPGFFNLENMMAPQNIALVVVSWSLTELISRSSRGWEFIRDHLLPVLPVIFCELFVFATATWQPQATTGERALLGALLGTVTVWGHAAVQNSPLAKFVPFLKAKTDEPTTSDIEKKAA